jgi:hypothetical protein
MNFRDEKFIIGRREVKITHGDVGTDGSKILNYISWRNKVMRYVYMHYTGSGTIVYC